MKRRWKVFEKKTAPKRYWIVVEAEDKEEALEVAGNRISVDKKIRPKLAKAQEHSGWTTKLILALMFIALMGCGSMEEDDDYNPVGEIRHSGCDITRELCITDCERMTDQGSASFCRSYCTEDYQWCVAGN